MSEWKEYLLDDFIDVVKKTYLPIKGDNFPYIGLEHIEQQTLRLNGVGSSDAVTSQKFMFSSGDVLFGKLRPYFRKVVQPNFSGVCSTDIWVLKARKGHYQNFIKYFVAASDFIETCNIGESGTRMPRADWGYLKDTTWLLPSYEEQKAIAELLSSLDNKIDFLHRNNKTLEQLAETLFRLWFKEGADDNWDELPLGKVFDIGIGRTPPRLEKQWFTMNPDDIKWVSIKDMGSGGLYMSTVSEYLTEDAIKRFNIPIIPKNTVMLSFKMTIGRVAISTERMVSNEAIAHFKQKDKLSPEFLYLFFEII